MLMQTEAFITLDLHGKNVYQSKLMIDAALRRAGGAYALRLVHGYHHGEAIKEMIAKTYPLHPQVLSVSARNDGGCTELLLRRL